MNKSELVDAIVAKTAETKKATEATVNALVEVIAEERRKSTISRIWYFRS